ncbi:MAG: hypothetical protein ACQEXV_18970 [Bacillota bacterium]|uniref:hypothetical protein n=1 Tax=Paenibacillus jamilae TaxID=114136 RepID=UPI000E3C0405|nr:hypothetical protein [Paenibacillus jamilae]RFT93268.1 hypothetical protein DX902_22345 [Paenibacillus jamilae]
MDKFENITKLLKELIDSKVIIPQPINANDFIFRYEDKQLEKALEKHPSIEKKNFLNVLNKEISRYILAIHRDTLEVLIRFTLEDDADQEKIKEQEEELRAKIGIVQKYLINENIINSLKLKISSKNYLLKNLDWELNHKSFDSFHGTLESLKYVTLDLISTTSNADAPFGFFNPFVNSDKHLILNLTLEDVDYLLMELNKIKKVITSEQGPSV